MTTKIQKWGNSLAIRIPKEFANSIHIEEGSDISFSVKGQTLVIKEQKKKVYTLRDLLKGYNTKDKHEETIWGAFVGKEILEW